MATILLINGPNLNLLGQRQPQHYGRHKLEEIIEPLVQQAANAGHLLVHRQSNAEHELVAHIHQAPLENTAFIIVNPAAYTHTSVAMRDALAAVDIPFIELHISNVHSREPFRRHSYFSDIARGTISGFGPYGYELALQAALAYLDQHA